MATSVLDTPFFWLFLTFYITHEVIELILDVINYLHTKKQKTIPDFYQDTINQATFEKSQAYNLERMRFDVISHFVQIPFFWFLIFMNGFRALDAYAASYAGVGTLTHSVLFCLFITVYFAVIQLPFKIYSTFVIEEKYGFNKTTFDTFVLDMIKTIIIGALLGIPILYVVFWFMHTAGNYWWLWVWAVLTLIQFFIAAIYPTFLAPIFNKFTPLEDGELNDRITALAKKIHFKMSGVFVIDGSKRSGHSNAYFAGMGKFRRIVLFDTLIKQLTTNELVAVLAHEMGHNVKKHIRNSMILSTVISLLGFYVLSLLIQWPQFYQAFNVDPSPHAAFIIFSVTSEIFTFLLTPLMNLWSRKNEYEADAFSAQMTQDKEAMKNSLLKLTQENLSNLTPHPAYSFYHYSHPTTVERARAIDAV